MTKSNKNKHILIKDKMFKCEICVKYFFFIFYVLKVYNLVGEIHPTIKNILLHTNFASDYWPQLSNCV